MGQQEEGEEALAAAAAAVDNGSNSAAPWSTDSKSCLDDHFVLADLNMLDTKCNVAAAKKALEESSLEGPVARAEVRMF